jgi:hypothetical protein
MKKRYSEEQIIGFLKEADAGHPVVELCRKHGFSDASYYKSAMPSGSERWKQRITSSSDYWPMPCSTTRR